MIQRTLEIRKMVKEKEKLLTNLYEQYEVEMQEYNELLKKQREVYKMNMSILIIAIILIAVIVAIGVFFKRRNIGTEAVDTNTTNFDQRDRLIINLICKLDDILKEVQ